MDLKQARSRIRAARTAIEKASDIAELCMSMEKYSARHTALNMAVRELHQQNGRLDLIEGILREVESGAELQDSN